jgi:hypothetical protein
LIRSSDRSAAPTGWLPPLIALLVLGAGCSLPCGTEGTEGLAGFDLDCDRCEWLITGDAMHTSLFETEDGIIDLEMPRVDTLGSGLRFGDDGEFDLDGQYHDSLVSVAPMDDGYLLITHREDVEDEAYFQLVDFEFFVEIEPTSTFVGGTLSGTVEGVPVFEND